MKLDRQHDVGYIRLRKGKVSKTVTMKPGILFDLDRNGEVVGIEILSLEKLAPSLQVEGKRTSGHRVEV